MLILCLSYNITTVKEFEMAFENTFYGFATFISVGHNDRDRTTVRFNRKTLILFLKPWYSLAYLIEGLAIFSLKIIEVLYVCGVNFVATSRFCVLPRPFLFKDHDSGKAKTVWLNLQVS